MAGLVVHKNFDEIGNVLNRYKVVPAVAVEVDKITRIVEASRLNAVVAHSLVEFRPVMQVQAAFLPDAVSDVQVEKPVMVDVTHREPATHDLHLSDWFYVLRFVT